MTNGFCNGCGQVFDVRQPSCPRCRRCPECGTNVSGEAYCPGCEHPRDEVAVAALVRKLDPSLPKNRRWIQRMQTENRVNRLFAQMHWGKLIGLFLPLHLLAVLAWMWLFDQIGWPRGSLAAALLTTALMWWYVRRQLGMGRWTWLLRSSASAKPGM